MRSTSQTLLYVINVVLIVAVLNQVERICFLVSPGSRWWKCCLMKAASFLLWMEVVLGCWCLAFPSFWNSVCALGSMQEADCDCPKWAHDRKMNVLLISIDFIMPGFHYLWWNSLKLLFCSYKVGGKNPLLLLQCTSKSIGENYFKKKYSFSPSIENFRWKF